MNEERKAEWKVGKDVRITEGEGILESWGG